MPQKSYNHFVLLNLFLIISVFRVKIILRESYMNLIKIIEKGLLGVIALLTIVAYLYMVGILFIYTEVGMIGVFM